MSGKKPPEQKKDPQGPEEELVPEKETEEEKPSKKHEVTTSELLESMTKEAQKLAEELADEKDKHLRIMAEYDNFRKRSQKERENIYSEVRADTLIKLLPVYDNLERALSQETTDEAYRKGVEMTMNQFKEIMQKLGVTEIDAKSGDKFDPAIHNAVMHIEDETFGECVVVEEFQKGFKLGNKVIRCSVVKVAN